MSNLRNIDLNLLPVFEAIYEERSVSRAAKRLAMTRAAVSEALSQLQSRLREDLFIHRAQTVAPTPAADRVYEHTRKGLAAIREAVTGARDFDPKKSQRFFTLAIAHPLGPIIAVRLRDRLRQTAPGIHLSFSTRSRPRDLPSEMKHGQVDVAIDWLPPAYGDYHTRELFRDGLVAVARKGHPALRGGKHAMALRDLEFVILRPRSGEDSPVPGVRQWHRLRLNVVLEVSEMVEVFMVASQSDLCAVIPRSMQKMASNGLGLQPLPSSPKSSPVPVMLIWHASRDRDAAHRFVLNETLALAKALPI